MDIQTGSPGQLTSELLDHVGVYRYKVFVERLGWDLTSLNKREFDQFDRPDTVHLASRNEAGEINGSARLLPTTRPYLLGEVFPQLMHGLPVPCSPDVWELSRFAAVDLEAATQAPMGQFSSEVTLGLLHAAVAYARGEGAKRLITVSPLGIERLLRHTGVRAYRAAPPMRIGQHLLYACWIDCCDQ